MQKVYCITQLKNGQKIGYIIKYEMVKMMNIKEQNEILIVENMIHGDKH